VGPKPSRINMLIAAGVRGGRWSPHPIRSAALRQNGRWCIHPRASSVHTVGARTRM